MINIEISEKLFTINGKSLSFPIAIDELKSVLSEPELFKKKYNKVYTFHEFGLLAYSKNGQVVESFSVIFDPDFKRDFSPKNKFNQSISIKGLAIDSFYKINKKKIDTFGSMPFGSFNLYFDDNEDDILVFEIQEYVPPPPKPVSDKYKIRKITGKKLVFTDFNFKLAVMQELMYNQKLLKPKFDLYEFVKFHTAREIDVEAEGYEFIAEVTDYFQQFEIEAALADKVTEIIQDGGNDIYLEVLRFWDGEDDVFNIRSFKDAAQFKNLKSVSLFYYAPEDRQVFEELKQHGIEYNFI
jgi:hypothetical protein